MNLPILLQAVESRITVTFIGRITWKLEGIAPHRHLQLAFEEQGFDSLCRGINLEDFSPHSTLGSTNRSELFPPDVRTRVHDHFVPTPCNATATSWSEH
jgi:hypothetical protein